MEKPQNSIQVCHSISSLSPALSTPSPASLFPRFYLQLTPVEYPTKLNPRAERPSQKQTNQLKLEFLNNEEQIFCKIHWLWLKKKNERGEGEEGNRRRIN